MYPEPTELLLIRCLTESIWTPKSKSNTLTPKTNSQTYWQREISHVTNGTVFFICSTSAISALLAAARRVQEQKEEERIVAKSESTAANLSSTVPASSSSAQDPGASRGPGVLIASGKSQSRVRRNSRPDEAPSSQVKLKDENLGWLMDDSARKPVAKEENQVLWEFPESESWIVHEDEVTGKPVAWTKGAVKPAASSMSENSGNPEAERRNWPHNFYISSGVVSYTDKVYSIERKTYDRGPTDEMEDLNVNAAVWWRFMNTTLQAAVHLGQDCDQNLRFAKNHFWSSLKMFFKETEKLIKNQTEINGVATID